MNVYLQKPSSPPGAEAGLHAGRAAAQQDPARALPVTQGQHAVGGPQRVAGKKGTWWVPALATCLDSVTRKNLVVQLASYPACSMNCGVLMPKGVLSRVLPV